MPRIIRPPLAIWRVEAIRATTAGCRLTTFRTNVPTVIRWVAPAAIARIVGPSTTGTVTSPRPMKWSHAQTPAYPAASSRLALSSHHAGSARIVRIDTPIGSRSATLEPRLEEPDVLGRAGVTVAARVLERPERAERVEVGGEPADHVEHDLLDPLRVLGEDLENAAGVDRLGAFENAGV